MFLEQSEFKIYVNRLLPIGSTRRMFDTMPVRNLFKVLWALIRSAICTFKLTGRLYPLVVVVFPNASLSILQGSAVGVNLQGRLIVRPLWMGAAILDSCSQIEASSQLTAISKLARLGFYAQALRRNLDGGQTQL